MAMSPWPKLKRDLVAILRGIRPEEVEPILERLIEAGFEAIEIPLNSPDPFVSIERAARLAPASVMIGAGTVLTPADVDRLAGCGGRLLVSPNVDGAVLDRAGELGLVSMPGIMTPTEAFTALRHGASGLKVFPAGVLGPAGIGAMRAVLPKATVIGAVGGIDETSFAAYRAVGVAAFGLGSSLYRPGMTADEVAVRAERSIAAFDAAAAG
ncbi:2-dehydro-3-deoxy-6-phosphogalactonate aldolase [Cereibacter sphaeroides]|uniref:2-dehydro-3-deoxy-6-phosphogalactonate aldolase n=1 Tax=Cereibacter sphaeroides TaxID=1063 RepID=A0AAX1UFQ7_CERSP|nr:2-dehydro-3-deoxy-6-phosphogalactonate aldolase [Cereibacter sphaeroides]RHZ90895.1 2-dehydro-3-deoxy-6-phosphogalactonate aldolase [Cereibacter sphaeroides]